MTAADTISIVVLLQHQQLLRQNLTIGFQPVHVRPGCQVSTVVILSIPSDDVGTCCHVVVSKHPHPLAQPIVDGQGRFALIRQDKAETGSAVEGIRVILLSAILSGKGAAGDSATAVDAVRKSCWRSPVMSMVPTDTAGVRVTPADALVVTA